MIPRSIRIPYFLLVLILYIIIIIKNVLIMEEH